MKSLTDWDVIALGLRLIETNNKTTYVSVDLGKTQAKVVRIKSAATTHGYIVASHAMLDLYNAFSACEIKRDYGTAIDTCWVALQQTGKWYAFDPQLGTQSASFSDIEKQFTDYMQTRWKFPP